MSFTYAPAKTVLRTGFGVFVGPGQTEDQIQPIESDRISSTISNASFPVDPAALVANFVDNPNNRSYQPRAYANEYTIPERVYQYTASIQRELPGNMSATAAYVVSQGRNLFLRSVANQIVQALTNPNPANAAIVLREFSIPVRDASGAITGVQNPYAEVDYKTSGGRDTYNALQLSLNKRSSAGLSTNLQYTLGRSRGNTAGSNEAQTAANNARSLADFDYDLGYNSFDVRHTFNLSVLYQIPYSGPARALLGGWQVGGIVNARSGLPVPVQIVRPDVVYSDASGNIFESSRRPRRNHQYARRRCVAQRPTARSGPRGESVHQGRRAPLLESRGLRDPTAGHVRQPRAQLHPRTGVQPGRSGHRQAVFTHRDEEPGVPRGSLQRAGPCELCEPCQHTAAGDSHDVADGSEPRAAGATVQSGGGWNVRTADGHGRPEGRARHTAAGTVRAARELLNRNAGGRRAHRGFLSSLTFR